MLVNRALDTCIKIESYSVLELTDMLELCDILEFVLCLLALARCDAGILNWIWSVQCLYTLLTIQLELSKILHNESTEFFPYSLKLHCPSLFCMDLPWTLSVAMHLVYYHSILLLAIILVCVPFVCTTIPTVSFEIIFPLVSVTFLYYEETALSPFLWMDEQLDTVTVFVETVLLRKDVGCTLLYIHSVLLASILDCVLFRPPSLLTVSFDLSTYCHSIGMSWLKHAATYWGW